jgi:hypothetical protein
MKFISRLHCLIAVNVFIFLSSHAQTTQVQYLSGTGADKTVDWQFSALAGGIPANGRLSGSVELGTTRIGHIQFRLHQTVSRHGTKACINTIFSALAWKGQQVNIVFEGSMTILNVKLTETCRADSSGCVLRFKYMMSANY